MGKSTPAPPDPMKTAEAQGQMNKETAIAQRDLNMFDTEGPYGATRFEKIPEQFDQAGYDAAMSDYTQRLADYNSQPAVDPNTIGWSSSDSQLVGPKAPVAPVRDDFSGTDSGVTRYKRVTELSPDQQRMLDLSNQAAVRFGEIGNEQLDRVGGRLSEPFDLSSLGDAPTANEETRQNVRQSIIDRMSPVHEQDRRRLETNLANQGIQQGSEAWRRGVDDYNRQMTDFRLAADQQAGNEMSRTFGLERSARDAMINEMAQQRQIPLNELISLTQGQQVQSPSFAPIPQGQIAAPDFMGATYNSAELASRNAKMKNDAINATIGNVLAGGATMGASFLAPSPMTTFNFGGMG